MNKKPTSTPVKSLNSQSKGTQFKDDLRQIKLLNKEFENIEHELFFFWSIHKDFKKLSNRQTEIKILLNHYQKLIK
jgi:hypothetical protein